MKRTIRLLGVFLFLSLGWPATAQEPPSKREGVIVGRVVAGDGQPLMSVTVMTITVGKPSITGATQRATCDADGNFKLTGLSHGVYRLMAMAPGYVTAPNQSLEYRIGETAIINLVRGGVITGRVTDEFGEPIVGFRVSAERARDPEDGSGTGAASLNAWNSSRLTDDRGVYRIFGLEPGGYVVGVNGASSKASGMGQARREPPTYHPSSPRASAVRITLRAGEEISGVDIRARTARGRSISGTISGDTQGEGLFNAVGVTLLGVADKHLAGMTTVVGGRDFSLHGVEDGEYELSAVRFSESLELALSTPRRVSVKGADLSGIDLKLLKLGSISGRVVIEVPQSPPGEENACKSAAPFTVEEILIETRRDEKTPGALASVISSFQSELTLGNATPDKDGGFTLKNLEAGRHWFLPGLPDDNWYLRAITQTGSGAPKPVDVARAGLTLKQGEKQSGVEIIIARGAAGVR